VQTVHVDLNALNERDELPVLGEDLPGAALGERVNVLDSDGELVAAGAVTRVRPGYIVIHVDRHTMRASSSPAEGMSVAEFDDTEMTAEEFLATSAQGAPVRVVASREEYLAATRIDTTRVSAVHLTGGWTLRDPAENQMSTEVIRDRVLATSITRNRTGPTPSPTCVPAHPSHPC
jgi:hypothetical protein